MKKLSKLQREVLIGILLGDGHVRSNTHKTKYRLIVLQSDAHKQYVFHLYDIFKNFVDTPPKKYTFTDKRFPGKIYSRWSFYTRNEACFRFYAHQFYENKKILPKRIDKWLSPRAIAYWYINDGAMKWKNKSLGVRFCTDNFSVTEVDTLINVLQENYKLKCSKQKKQSNFRIYISSYSYNTLTDLIFRFLIPSMTYKYPLPFASCIEQTTTKQK